MKSLNRIPEFSITLSHKVKASDLFTVTTSSDVAEVARKCFNDGEIEWRECFLVIALSKANKVIGFHRVSSGGLTGTVADPRIILQFALLSNACSLILSHNHPSGSLKPSRADEELTQKIKTAASYLDIKVLDHVIITAEGYYSFADEGVI
jgi:DNA repair protein RadC